MGLDVTITITPHNDTKIKYQKVTFIFPSYCSHLNHFSPHVYWCLYYHGYTVSHAVHSVYTCVKYPMDKLCKYWLLYYKKLAKNLLGYFLPVSLYSLISVCGRIVNTDFPVTQKLVTELTDCGQTLSLKIITPLLVLSPPFQDRPFPCLSCIPRI